MSLLAAKPLGRGKKAHDFHIKDMSVAYLSQTNLVNSWMSSTNGTALHELAEGTTHAMQRKSGRSPMLESLTRMLYERFCRKRALAGKEGKIDEDHLRIWRSERRYKDVLELWAQSDAPYLPITTAPEPRTPLEVAIKNRNYGTCVWSLYMVYASPRISHPPSPPLDSVCAKLLQIQSICAKCFQI